MFSFIPCLFGAAGCPCIRLGEFVFQYILRCPFLTCMSVIIFLWALLRSMCCICCIIKWIIRKLKPCDIKKLGCYGQYAVITGASDGIGKAMAIELAKNDFQNFVLIGRNMEKLKDTETQLMLVAKPPVNIQSVVVDYAKSSAKEIYKTISEAVKGLDVGILINNVGISYPHALYYDELEPEFIEELISVNVTSTLMTTRAILPGMKQKKSGLIVCVGSGASAIPSDPLYCAYAATKSSAEAFCRSLRVECKPFNIEVQCHLPLLVTTKLSKCKTPTLMVPTAKAYASAAVTTMSQSLCCANASPYWMHSVILTLSNSIPSFLWHKWRMGQCVNIRDRALHKKREVKKDE